jgi:protease-4
MNCTRFALLPLLAALLLLPVSVRADEEPNAEQSTKGEPSAAASDSAEAPAAKKDEKRAKARLAYIVLSGSLPEGAPSGSPFAELSTDLATILERIERASNDDKIDGLVLEFKGLAAGYGQMNELRGAIARFRKTGKKVHAYMETGNTPDYLVATACNDITLPESGYLTVPGLRIEATFYKGMFDVLGVKADFVHMGEAKGFAESYTRRGWSKPVKENLTAMVDGLYEHVIETITNDRPIRRNEVVEAVDIGLLPATKALEIKFIDHIAYGDQLKQQLAETYNAEELVYVLNYGKKEVDTDFSGPTGMFKLLKLLSGSGTGKSSSGKKVAVVYAVGPIMSGKSSSDLFGSSTLGSDTIVEALRQANEDDDVVAIVLRIDSPGGSAVASDMMWREIETLDKPIVASMGDTAASGGYYIAMGCDKIYAEPGTITGSIGVVGGKIALGRLMDRVGIETGVISRGKNSGMFSATEGFSASQREVFRQSMEETYEQFTSKAAAGRNMPIEKLKDLAGGKVYTGIAAKQNGLVDELGTLHEAIEAAKKLANVDPDEKVKIETLPEPVDFFKSLFGDNEAEKEVAIKIGVEQLSPELAAMAQKARLMQQMFKEPVVLTMPFELTVE